MAINFTGKWELDRARSESLYAHMKALGCDEIAALASEKLTIVVNIFQNEKTLTIYQNSQLGDTMRVLRLDGNETAESASRTALATLTPGLLTIATRFPQGSLLDRRSFEDDTRKVVAQLLELSVKDGPTIVTKRFLTYIGPPEVPQPRESMV